MREESVPVLNHRATRLCSSDKTRYDYFVGMEERNLIAMRRVLGEDTKVCRLLDFAKIRETSQIRGGPATLT